MFSFCIKIQLFWFWLWIRIKRRLCKYCTLQISTWIVSYWVKNTDNSRYFQLVFHLWQNKGKFYGSVCLSLAKPIYKLGGDVITLLSFPLITYHVHIILSISKILLVQVVISNLYHEHSSYKGAKKLL